jgi:hypothetical protein
LVGVEDGDHRRRHRQHRVERDGVDLLAVARAREDCGIRLGTEIVLDAMPHALEVLG